MRLTLLIIRLRFSLFKLTSTQPILNILAACHNRVLLLQYTRPAILAGINVSMAPFGGRLRTLQNSTNA